MALIALGVTFAVDLEHPQGPSIAVGLAGFALVGFALAFWSLGRRSRTEPHTQWNILSESSPDGLLVTDQQGNFLQSNSAFHKLLTFAAEETSSREFASLSAVVEAVGSPQGADDLKRLVARVLNGGDGFVDISLTSFDSMCWRRISARPGAGWIFWRVEDMASTREIDNPQRLETACLIDYIDCLPVGFFSADAEGVIRYANQTLARWLGLPPDRLVG